MNDPRLHEEADVLDTANETKGIKKLFLWTRLIIKGVTMPW